MGVTILKADRRHLDDINRVITGVRISGPLDKLPQHYWFVRADSRVVGCAGGEFIDETTFIIMHVAVEREHQKNHIGMDLLDFVMKYAREHGATSFALITMYYRFNWFKRRGFRTSPRSGLPDAVRNHWMFTAKRYMKCAAMIT